jgi:hypothetical protein
VRITASRSRPAAERSRTVDRGTGASWLMPTSTPQSGSQIAQRKTSLQLFPIISLAIMPKSFSAA